MLMTVVAVLVAMVVEATVDRMHMVVVVLEAIVRVAVGMLVVDTVTVTITVGITQVVDIILKVGVVAIVFLKVDMATVVAVLVTQEAAADIIRPLEITAVTTSIKGVQHLVHMKVQTTVEATTT
jgi:hypothetical protein